MKLRWLRPPNPGKPAVENANERAGKDLPSEPLPELPKHSPEAAAALARRYCDLGNQAISVRQLEAAEKHLRAALVAQDDYLPALCNLGALLKDLGRTVEAETFFARALRHQPRNAAAAFNLGLLRLNQRNWSGAVELLRTAVSAQPKDVDARYWFGNALMGWGDASAAMKEYRAALRLDPKRVQARWGHVMAQIPALAQTDAEHAAGVQAFAEELSKLKAWFRAQPALDGSAAVGAQQPYYLAYREGDHRVVLGHLGTLCVSLMAGWARRAGLPAPARGTAPRFRLGVVSAHINSHSVWHALIRGWVEYLDPARFEIHIFHTGAVCDAETEWAARKVARFHHGAQDWKAWVRLVAESHLDALVYPEIGMDATTVRLASLRLARLQLGSWGHPITSGLPTIDGYISAEAFEPADAASHYTEDLILLPKLGCNYLPYGTVPAKVDFEELGIRQDDRILLCSGVPFKYAPRYDEVLVEIARRCSPCKLVFFRDSSSSLADQLQQRLQASFGASGLSPIDTLCFVRWQSQAAFFAFLDRALVYLDTMGFSGFNTTMQAVERGTPIVAFEGRFMRGRFASGILRQAGLEEWIADTPDGFVDRVARLVADDSARNEMRRRISDVRGTLYADKASVALLGQRIADLLDRDSIVPVAAQTSSSR